MNLQTTYLGLTLRNPLVVGASPFCDDLDACRRLEESGAAALVMHSLFEEQIDLEQQALLHHLETPAESNYEATSYFPHFDDYHLTPAATDERDAYGPIALNVGGAAERHFNHQAVKDLYVREIAPERTSSRSPPARAWDRCPDCR